MPMFSTKHKGREKSFSIKSFHDGYSQEQNPAFMTRNQLSECKNLKYVIKELSDGSKVVTLSKRPGTTESVQQLCRVLRMSERVPIIIINLNTY